MLLSVRRRFACREAGALRTLLTFVVASVLFGAAIELSRAATLATPVRADAGGLAPRYFAAREPTRLNISRLGAADRDIRLRFTISLGVRHGDRTRPDLWAYLKARADGAPGPGHPEKQQTSSSVGSS
jgi:hypothetical protein